MHCHPLKIADFYYACTINSIYVCTPSCLMHNLSTLYRICQDLVLKVSDCNSDNAESSSLTESEVLFTTDTFLSEAYKTIIPIFTWLNTIHTCMTSFKQWSHPLKLCTSKNPASIISQSLKPAFCLLLFSRVLYNTINFTI